MESTIWEDNGINHMKYEKSLSFTAAHNSEDDDYAYSKKKLPRDPLSHRIIEKRRRDRMNNCLSDLSRLIPSEYMKKGRGRVEKTEIIEMAIKHMKHLQSHPCTEGSCCPLMTGSKTELNKIREDFRPDHKNDPTNKQTQGNETNNTVADSYKLGFNECLSETLHFLVEVEGFFSSDSLCQQLSAHLNKHCHNVLKSKGFMAQLGAVTAAAANSKRRLEEYDQHTDYKPGLNTDCYNGGYQHLPDSSRTSQHNENGNNTVTSQYSVFPADSSSSALQPNYTSFHNLPRSIAFSQQLSPNSYTSSYAAHSYKFKEDIRKRFCKEAVSGPVIPVNGQGLGTRKIPGFALSSRGSYYIPLTLDLPYLDDDVPRDREQAVLHPVTISVSFPQHPSQFSETGQ